MSGFAGDALTGRHAVVTGGSRGIGAAIAKALQATEREGDPDRTKQRAADVTDRECGERGVRDGANWDESIF